MANSPDAGADIIRKLLLAVVVLGTAGLLLELALLEHTESVLQWIPLALLGAGLPAAAALALRPGARTLRLFRVLMGLFVLSGAAGLWLHYRGNALFEREMDDAAAGLDLAWRALRGATPALAPGAMAQLGLLGLILAYRHPAERREPSNPPAPAAGDRTGKSP